MAAPVPEDVQALVRARRKIDAIKRLREHTGLGLKEAKDRVDLLEREMGLPPLPSVATKLLLFWTTLIVVALLVWWGASLLQRR